MWTHARTSSGCEQWRGHRRSIGRSDRAKIDQQTNGVPTLLGCLVKEEVCLYPCEKGKSVHSLSLGRLPCKVAVLHRMNRLMHELFPSFCPMITDWDVGAVLLKY